MIASPRGVSSRLFGRGLLRVASSRGARAQCGPLRLAVSLLSCSVAQLADGGGPAAAASAPATRRLLVVQRVAARPLPQPLEEAALLPRALAHVFWNTGKKGWISDHRIQLAEMFIMECLGSAAQAPRPSSWQGPPSARPARSHPARRLAPHRDMPLRRAHPRAHGAHGAHRRAGPSRASRAGRRQGTAGPAGPRCCAIRGLAGRCRPTKTGWPARPAPLGLAAGADSGPGRAGRQTSRLWP